MTRLQRKKISTIREKQIETRLAIEDWERLAGQGENTLVGSVGTGKSNISESFAIARKLWERKNEK